MTAEKSLVWGGSDGQAYEARYGWQEESSYRTTELFPQGGAASTDYLSALTAAEQSGEDAISTASVSAWSGSAASAEVSSIQDQAASVSLAVETASVTSQETQRSASYVPNDPKYGSQWNLASLGMSTAWDYNLGGRKDVTVAVIDSGLSKVSDFGSTTINWSAAKNFVRGGSNVSDPSSHGTHVTGTIAQSTNNGQGVAGIAYNTTILPIKAINDNGTAWDSNIISAVDYAIAQGADVINLSLGGEGQNAALEAAMKRAYDAGVLVVAAAGNSGKSSLELPAGYSTVLAVGALDASGSLASWSNHSKYMVTAPGENIIQQMSNGAYGGWAGTSMATPHVSALAALILSEAEDQGYTLPTGSARAQWLMNVITSTAKDLGSKGQDSTYGWGEVQADKALASLQGGSLPYASSLYEVSEQSFALSYSDASATRSSNGQGYSAGPGASQSWLSFSLEAGQGYEFALDQAQTQALTEAGGLSLYDVDGNLVAQAQWNQAGQAVLAFTAGQSGQFSLALDGVGASQGEGLSQTMLATLQDLEVNGLALNQATAQAAGWSNLLGAFQQDSQGLAAANTQELAANLSTQESKGQLAAA